MDMRLILVPVDFSPDSLNALSSARGLAKQFGAELLLLHVIAPIDLITVSDVFEEQRRAGDAALTRIGAELRTAGQRFRVMVKAGVPSRLIVDTARRSGADLIVLGTHGRTGLAHMLIGSVAEKVVRTATCPVLTVRRLVRKKRAPGREAR
jgi:universal stress protein A